jgi:tRNA threonylcarbamoyladenosine biosynthesis protein TsaB
VLTLALDTSSAAGSAAVARGGALLVERAGDGSRTHGERLPAELMAVLRDAGLSLDDVDRLAVAVGPGSFTGLRVGIAAIQGLALARRLPVAPVTSFEALAWIARGTADAIGAWIDAHRGEVFAALFAGDGRTPLLPPASLSPHATLDAWADALAPFARVRFTGDGASRYRDAIAARLGGRAAVDAAAPALAGAIASIAGLGPGRAVPPHAVVPLYVRRSDAELARDRRHAAPKP